MLDIFKTRSQIFRDRDELADLYQRYQERLAEKLAQRAADEGLSARDRRHWKRLMKQLQADGGLASLQKSKAS
jgi:uncharacterized protein YpiB (UPF0302 family)